MRCLKVGGLLCASATDLGAMSGRFGEQCAARYGAQPLRSGAKLAPELALRMLLASVARAAGAAGRRIRPLLSVTFADFFVRVIVEVVEEAEEVVEEAEEEAEVVLGAEGAAEAEEAEAAEAAKEGGGTVGLFFVCTVCGAAEAQALGRPQSVGAQLGLGLAD